MEWMFGRRKTFDEILRQNVRALKRTMRDLDRERANMETLERKLIMDMKKMAKENRMDVVKIMAKDLVRTRHNIKKFILMKANIQGVSLKIQTMKSQNEMGKALKGVTNAMMAMNKQMNLPHMYKTIQDFEKQTGIMEMKGEMMSDAMDDAMGNDEEEEEETKAIIDQVLDELGLSVSDKMAQLPGASIPLPAGTDTVSSQEDNDLMARLEKLRKE